MRWPATVLAALAGFVPLPLPPGASPGDESGIQEFAASGNTWAARTSDPRDVQLSTDAGASWRTIRLGDNIGAGIAVGPDGSFWLPANSPNGRTLIRVTHDGDVSVLQLQLPVGLLSPPAWDPEGNMWVAQARAASGSDGTVMTAYRVLPENGSVAEQVQATSKAQYDFPWVRFSGNDGYVSTSNAVFRIEGSKLVLLSGSAKDDTEFVQDDLWPEATFGPTVVAFHAISNDDGAHWTYTNRAQYGVHGNPDLLLRFPVDQQGAGEIMRRCSATVFCDTGIAAPEGTRALWQTPAGLVAVGADSAGSTFGTPGGNQPVFEILTGAVPKQGPNLGTQSRSARALLARLGFHRKRAGLPPLISDARMSAAALAHARYLLRNVPRRKLSLVNGHSETRGKPGFTGVDPAARCLAQSVLCTGEEVIEGKRPSDTIVSLYYHRLAVMSPFTSFIGAATAGPFTVFVVDTHREAISVAPVGYPNGRYDGPLTLQGRELPDPWELCKPDALPVGSYRGVPITFTPPGREPARPVNRRYEVRIGPDTTIFGVRLFTGKRAVPGCQNNGTFMPKPALRPHTTYTAKAVWRTSPSAPRQTYTWHFRTR